MEHLKLRDNRSVFYAPIRFNHFKEFTAALEKDPRYETACKGCPPQYLLPYAVALYRDDARYRAYDLKAEYIPAFCTFDDPKLPTPPSVEAVRISCFATGCAFAEIHLVYHGYSFENIENLAFRFKNATKRSQQNEQGRTTLDLLLEILPPVNKEDLFFTGSAFKRECRMFHHIFTDKPPENPEIHLRRLSRGYHAHFPLPRTCGDYDMLYQPYEYDHWAGSQEGLVNLFYPSGDTTTDRFLERYKRKQLICNYGFLYLILLNQRFSAIMLIEDIARFHQLSGKEKDLLSERITQLKTEFSFNVLSDDQLYQNVYQRMYKLLDIDRLLDDIQDNEQQADMRRRRKTYRNELLTGCLLFGLSLLSVFSALVDAAGFFDRFPAAAPIATALSIFCAVTVIAATVVWWLVRRRQ